MMMKNAAVVRAANIMIMITKIYTAVIKAPMEHNADINTSSRQFSRK